MFGDVATSEDPRRRPRSSVRALCLAVVIGAVALPGGARGFDKRLGVGAGGGYSQLFRNQAGDPASAYGGGAVAHLTFGITDTFGVSLAGGMAWFGGYTPTMKMETVDDEGNPTMVRVAGPEVSGLTVWDLALSVIYAIDVSLVVPYLELGAVVARVAEDRDGAEAVDLDVGMRTNLGFDYQLLGHMTLGALAGLDTYFTAQSHYGSAFHFMVRLTVVWDLAELGRDDDNE